jgi:hypothetical protein
MYIGLNLESFEVFGCSNSYEVLCEKAAKAKVEAFHVAPVDRVFSGLKVLSLLQCYKHLNGEEWVGEIFPALVNDACIKLCSKLKPTGKAPPPKVEEDTEPVKERLVTRQERPKEGSVTRQVWDHADAIYATGCKDPKRIKELLLEKCHETYINPATAMVQFGKWRCSKSI